MRRLLPALPPLVFLLSLAAPFPARATDPVPAQPTPREQTVQGLELIMQGLKRMIEQVPLYGPPEMTPNGDIILRRLSPPADGQPTPAAPPPAIAPGSSRL